MKNNNLTIEYLESYGVVFWFKKDNYNGYRGNKYNDIKSITINEEEYKGALDLYYNIDSYKLTILHVPQLNAAVDIDYSEGNAIEPYQGIVKTINEFNQIITRYENR